MMENEEKKKAWIVPAFIGGICLIGILVLMLMHGCTYSIQNTMTHGTASDVVDSSQTTETTTDANAEIPINP